MKFVKSKDIKKIKEVCYVALCPGCKKTTKISSDEMQAGRSSRSECCRYFDIKD